MAVAKLIGVRGKLLAICDIKVTENSEEVEDTSFCLGHVPAYRTEIGCLKNSDLENLDPRPEKLRPCGCLENSDLKNSDPRVSRKLRPKK